MGSLPPLPVHPEALPWPTREWPTGALDPAAAQVATEVRDTLFASNASLDYGDSLALLVIQHGSLVFEHYAAGTTHRDSLRSWSIAKSIVHALVGVLVGDGRLDIHSLAPIPEWHQLGDSRAMITIEHLLRMTDGLDFVEEYVEGQRSDVIEMLLESGREDVAGYARRRPGIHPPGTHWNYSSGTSNIVTGILKDIVGSGEAGMRRFCDERLFAPLGMKSARPRFDDAGTLIGSSYVFCTARDFARFGLLYLRDGIWEGTRILPEGWVDQARTLTPLSEGEYGAHWWLGRGGPDTFCAVGYEGQYIFLDPTRDGMVLRFGVSTPEQRERLQPELRKLISSMPRL